MSKFKVGDKAVVVRNEIAAGYTDDDGDAYGPGKVVLIVEEVDDEGDCYVKSDESIWCCYIAENNLKPLEEPAKYQVGDRLVVTGDTARWNHHFDAGTVVTVTTDEPSAGPRGVGYRVDSGKDYWWVAETDLKPYEEETARASVGTVTVDVQVRFMIGDVDVTDKLKGLVAAEVAA